MGAVTILADVQENVAAFIAAAQNVDTAEKTAFRISVRLLRARKR